MARKKCLWGEESPGLTTGSLRSKDLHLRELKSGPMIFNPKFEVNEWEPKASISFMNKTIFFAVLTS